MVMKIRHTAMKRRFADSVIWFECNTAVWQARTRKGLLSSQFKAARFSEYGIRLVSQSIANITPIVKGLSIF